MKFIPDSKGSNKLALGCLAVFMIVSVILLSGCVGSPMYHGEALDENRTLKRAVVAANHRGTSITQVSFIEHIWGNIWNGMNDRIRKMTGKPT